MSIPNQEGLSGPPFIFTLSSAGTLLVWSSTAKAFVTLASAGFSVPVQQVLGEWQEAGLFQYTGTAVQTWNGTQWVTKSAV